MIVEKRRMIFLMAAMLIVALTGCKDESSVIGDSHFQNEEYEQAVAAYTEFLTLKPNNIKTLYNRARAYEELGMYAEARKDFEKVLENDPDHAQTHLSIGNNHFRNKEYQDALYRTDLVLTKNAQNSQAYLLQGRSHQMQGDLKDAMNSYNTAISLNKEFGEAYLYRGTLRVHLKQKTLACNDFKMAASLDVDAADKAQGTYCK